MSSKQKCVRAALAFTEGLAWKTIELGTHKSKDNLIKATEKEGHKISRSAMRFVNYKNFTVVSTKRKLELFETTVGKLGFPDGARVDVIYAKLDELGYTKCPNETALQLRRDYKDQPMYESRIVVSEPLADADGGLDVLLVAHDSNGSWVSRRYAAPGLVWCGYYRLVFCRK